MLDIVLQHVLPHHALSRLMGRLTHCERPWWKNFMIRRFSRLYHIDLGEAESPNPEDYPHFNAFFTRALQAECRPIVEAPNAIACPADGLISQCGTLQGELLLQAKGKHYHVAALLGSEQRAQPFIDGAFATIYLSPRDYHRLHMPLMGQLREMVHIPGRLFSVNTATTAAVPGLFTRNERVVALFDTAAGPMVLVLVGAIFVASIETVWHGVVTPPTRMAPETWSYADRHIVLARGAEMGRFNMGSTIIVLFPRGRVRWQSQLAPGLTVKMGEWLGDVVESS